MPATGPPDDDFGFPVVAVPATATCPDAVVRFLVGELVAAGRVPAAAVRRVAEAVLHRETLGTTGIGRGIAMPHAKSDDVTEVAVVIGRLANPLDWSALDGEPVGLVCLMVTPRKAPMAALKTLDGLVRRLLGPDRS